MLTRQRAKSSAAAPAADPQPRQAGRQQEGRSTRSSSTQPAAAARKRTHAAAEASNHGSNTSSIAAAQHDPAPNKRSIARTQQPGERLPALMHVLAAYQPSALRATRSTASATTAAATAVQQMAAAAPATLTQALLAEPSYLTTLLAAALDTGSGAEAGTGAAAGALLALSSDPALQHGPLLEALAQPQHLQLLISGLHQNSSSAAELIRHLSMVPAAQAQLQQHTGVLLHLCQQQAASADMQSAAVLTLGMFATTAAGQQALQQHNLAPLLAGMADGGSSAEAAAGIVQQLVSSAAAHEVLLPYVAELLAAVNPQHTANIRITPRTVAGVALAVHQIARGSAAGRQAVMQHAGGLIAAVQQIAITAAMQPAEGQQLIDAAVVAGTLLFLLESEGGLQAFLQQVQQGQLGDHLLALLQLMDQEELLATILGEVYIIITDTPEGQQALLPHTAELLRFAQPQCSPQQASMAMLGVVTVVGNGTAGSQAVLQHADAVVQVVQQRLTVGHPAAIKAACMVVEQLLAAAEEHGQQPPLMRHIEAAVDALLQLVRHEDADITVSVRLLLNFAQRPAGKQLLAAPERMAVVLKKMRQMHGALPNVEPEDDEFTQKIHDTLLRVVTLVVEHFSERREVPAFVPCMLDMLNSSQDAVMIAVWALHLLHPLAAFKQGQLALLPIKGHLQYFVGFLAQPNDVQGEPLAQPWAGRLPVNEILRQLLAALDAAVVQLQQDQQQTQLAVRHAGVAAAQAQVQHRAQRQCAQLQAEFVAHLQQLDAASTHNQQLKQLLHAASREYQP